MDNSELLKRISARPDVFSGKPIIRNMRLSVETILSLLAQGASSEEILDDYPKLEQDDIRACIAYAHAVIAGDTLGRSLGGEAVRFLVDCCAGRRLAEWLRNEGHDVFDAGELESDPGDATLLAQAANSPHAGVRSRLLAGAGGRGGILPADRWSRSSGSLST